jgi:acyl-[acyl carrier protein]--UDP-N-acetylglucosamine O-acyltransferase
MKTEVSAIVVLPTSTKLISLDVAGRIVGDLITESVSNVEGADLKVLMGEDAVVLAGLLANQPRLDFPLSPFAVQDLSARDILIIDARAWLPDPLLPKLLARARSARRGIRLVDNRPGADASVTMAIALVAGQMTRSVLLNARTAQSGGLERVLSADTLAGTSQVEAIDLDALKSAVLVESYVDLSSVERHVLLDRANRALLAGVRIRDPLHCWIRGELVCGSDVDIEPNVIFEGRVVLGSGVKIGAHCIIKESEIGANTRINPYSLIERAVIGTSATVGPYGRIRPGSRIADAVQIGNYVEIKNSEIGSRSRINHHAFIGDATIAEDVTVGAGTITCNHDGVRINRTVIERGAYIGSGCNLIAPLRVGERATIGAGSTITEDVPAMKLTLARPRQMTIDRWRGPRRD